MKRKKEHETILLVQRCLVTLWLSYKQHSTGWQLQKNRSVGLRDKEWVFKIH